ncbi:MAG: acyl carrier protein [Pirellulaceae bacterium]
MGFDVGELVKKVEEAFGIQIPDNDAQQVRTVGDLYDFVTCRVNSDHPGNCLTSAAFEVIRDGLGALGIAERFGPSTMLVHVLPCHGRRRFWFTLGQVTQLQLPDLIRPWWIVVTNAILTLVAAIVCAARTSSEAADSDSVFLVVFVLLLFVVGFFTAYLTRPWATRFPSNCASFRGLAERALILNVTRLKESHGAMGKRDIWFVLRELITDQLGVDEDEVTQDAHFAEDLGCE